MANKKSKFQPLTDPVKVTNYSVEQRSSLIDEICNGFIQPNNANRVYYRVILETVWPKGHGIPGPYVSEDDIRTAINKHRTENQFGRNPEEPYKDVFRRVRELQGEEGLLGLTKQGKIYQLIELELGLKRVPRTKINKKDWDAIKKSYANKCACCGNSEPIVSLQQDHKVPRTRGGADGLENFQPLCDECNNFKSLSCRNCKQICVQCCWAFPEKFKPVKLKHGTIVKLNEFCKSKNFNVNDFVNEVLLNHINGGLNGK